MAKVLGRYLGREALTLVKQQGLNALIGGGFLLGRFFLQHGLAGRIAVGTMTEMGVEGFVKMDSIGRGVGFLTAAAATAVALYPKLVRESFNNKKAAARAVMACFD